MDLLILVLKSHLFFSSLAQIHCKQGRDGVLRCKNLSEVLLIPKDSHDDVCGGYFVRLVTLKTLQNDYWWPILFSNCC